MREMLIELDVDPTDRRWQERANCLGVDPDLFFPERGASTKEAKAVCGGCEVQVPSASSTRCATARSSGSGVACPSGNAAASAASARSCAAASPAPESLARPARLRPARGLRSPGHRARDPGRPGPRSRLARRCRPTAGTRRSSGRGRGAGRGRPARRDATSVPLPLRELAHVQARVLDTGAVEVDEVHRHLRPALRLEHEAERAHAGEPAVAFADLARDAAGDR